MTIAADWLRAKVRRERVMIETAEAFAQPIAYVAICDGCGEPIFKQRAIIIDRPRRARNLFHPRCAP